MFTRFYIISHTQNEVSIFGESYDGICIFFHGKRLKIVLHLLMFTEYMLVSNIKCVSAYLKKKEGEREEKK